MCDLQLCSRYFPPNELCSEMRAETRLLHIVVLFNPNCNVSSVFADTFRQLRGNMFSVFELHADKPTDKHGYANRRIFVTFHCEHVKVLYVKFPTHFTKVITS